MEIYFLNSDFEEIFLLDVFHSFIWTDRFWECGDMQIEMSPRSDVLSILSTTSYFKIDESPHKMILETVSIEPDVKKGDILTLQGRSLESLLDRRIVWDSMALTGNLQTEVLRMLTDNVVAPSDSNRGMPFGLRTSTDTNITSLIIDTQYGGELVYDAICEICKTANIGFRVYYNTDDDLFWFKLYTGVDRSYNQTDRGPVAFTADLNNLLNANYIETGRFEKNVCRVGGEEGVGNVRTYVTVGSGTGLSRKETYLEANINRRTDDGELTDAEYEDALEGKGNEELAKKIYIQAFDGEVDPTMYNYGDEFEMGDILQIADEYGHQTTSRVIEVIYSQDEDGVKIYPTFETIPN